MAKEREVFKAFESNVYSLSADDRNVFVGMEDGKVGAVFSANKKEKFTTELTNIPITAVLADPFDVPGKSLFYAGDQKGNLYVLGEKGEVLDSSKVRDGPIFAIQPVEAKKIWVYSDKGRSRRIQGQKDSGDCQQKLQVQHGHGWTVSPGPCQGRLSVGGV